MSGVWRANKLPAKHLFDKRDGEFALRLQGGAVKRIQDLKQGAHAALPAT